MRPLIYKREKPDFSVRVSARGSIVPRKLPRDQITLAERTRQLVASNGEQKSS